MKKFTLKCMVILLTGVLLFGIKFHIHNMWFPIHSDIQTCSDVTYEHMRY